MNSIPTQRSAAESTLPKDRTASWARGRNPWPIAISVFFIVFFSCLVAFITYASTQHVDLVRSDYYEEELRFQQQLDRVTRTRQLGEPLAVTFDSGRQCIGLQLPPAHIGRSSGRIHLYRPSDARLDRELALAVDANGLQRIDTHSLRPGLWKVRVEWTAAGQDYFVDQAIVIAHAS